MAKKVLFRADSSSMIGLGHIKRDIVYASRLTDAEISFATLALEGNINAHIPYPKHVLKSNDVNELISLCQKENIDHLIIDNYEISLEDEKCIKKACSLILSVFDDTYAHHYCDEILNHNISADAKKYEGLVPSFTKISVIKPLIRDEFLNIKLRDRSIQNNKNKEILICMGGVDSENLSPRIIDVCKNFKGTDLHVVTTSINKHLNELKRINNINLHIDTQTMAEIMNRSDLAILTPSVIVHEALFMKLPFIAIKTASNQDDIYAYLEDHGYMTLDHFNAEILSETLEKVLS